MKILEITKRYKFSIVCLAVILYICFMKIDRLTPPDFFSIGRFDQLAHFLMFAGLTFVFFIEKYRKQYNNDSVNNFYANFKYIFTAIVIGFLIEVFQPILSTRSRELFDFVADVAGSCAGYFAFRLFKKLLKR